MILSDEKNLYIKNETMPKIIRTVGIEGAGLYLTIKSLEFDNPNGIEEIKILESSSDEIEKGKEILESLMEKGYVERIKEGIIKVTNKQFK